MTDDVWYFAYGSNLDAEQKEFRTGTIREARRCRAPGYRFSFNKRAADGSVYANVVPSSGDETWGVIYRCLPATLARMDDFEGVRGGHYVRHALNVVTEDAQTLPAITYVAGPAFVVPAGKPRRDYLRRIVEGARAHHLPAEYIRSIESLSAGKTSLK